MSRSATGLLSACLLAWGCSGRAEIPPVSVPLGRTFAALEAGVAEVDITPPPGLALFGHGPEGRVSVGMRLRLRCQAFVFAQGDQIVALLPCDLAAPSLQLQRKVAARLRDEQVPIGADRLFLMATHTHAGPAHYFESGSYSGSLSSYTPGYDPGVSDFLAERMSEAVATAYHALRPACLGWGYKTVYGLTRNRSYAPYAANVGIPEALQTSMRSAAAVQRGLLDTAETEPRPNTYSEAAVDPTLSVLRVDAAGPENGSGDVCGEASVPMGVFTVFGMHPTAISNKNDLYHGDIFGFASREIENCLQQDLGEVPIEECGRRALPLPAEGPRVVAGIANGIEGDVSPVIDMQAVSEARRLGRKLAEQVLDVYRDLSVPGRLSSKGQVGRVYRELKFPGARATPNASVQPLCDSARIGVAAAGGAEDGPTRFRIVPVANEGRRLAQPSGCHGVKLSLVPPAGHAKANDVQFPATAPIALLHIAGGYVATVPAELTTVTGLRIRAALEQELSRTGAEDLVKDRVAVVGLTNVYLQYVSTREEYQFQHYEGASTLYGPSSAEFLQTQLRCLATFWRTANDADCRLGQRQDVNQLTPIAWTPKPVVSLFEDGGCAHETRPLGDVPVHRVTENGMPGWQLELEGPPPWALAHREQLKIEVVGPQGGVVDDDRGSSVELRHDERWRVRWLPFTTREEQEHAPCGEHRIHVRGSCVNLRSQPFHLKSNCTTDTEAP